MADVRIPKETAGGEAPEDGGAERQQTGVPRLRTYSADMNRAIRSRGETLSSIALKEQAAKRRAPPRTANPVSHARLFVFASSAFILLGVLLLAGVFFITQKNDDAPGLPASIIFPNDTALVAAEGNTGTLIAALAAEREGADLSLGEVRRLIIVESGVALTPGEVARRLGMPDALSRQVTDIMVGIHSFDRNQPFIILSVAAYDRSLSALLAWERDMGRDLGAFFKPTAGTLPAPTLAFSDAVVQNVDVRRSQEAWPIIYAYPARTLAIITTNEFTLREVMARLGNARQDF